MASTHPEQPPNMRWEGALRRLLLDPLTAAAWAVSSACLFWAMTWEAGSMLRQRLMALNTWTGGGGRGREEG